jgi:WhiB family redox-sensing transcriptional regulator
MPTYRGWIAGQLQLFLPVGKGESWTGYITPVTRNVTSRVRPRGDKARNIITADVTPLLTSRNAAYSKDLRVVDSSPADPDDWRDRAACRVDLGVDPELFFPPNGARTDLDSPAKEACNACPVQTDCLEWALETRQRFGIWGGKTRHERRRIARERAIALGKASAVTKDQAQQWLRDNADDPFVREQLGKVLAEHSPDVHGTFEPGARQAMLALADMLDEADS